MNKLKKIIIVSAIALCPFLALATPTSWDFASGILQPLTSQRTAEVKANNFTATSTSASSTLPRLESTLSNSITVCINGDCRTAWPSGGGSDFPFTVQSWGNSTSTVIGLLNGFLSTASSTINAALRLPLLSQGLAYIGSTGLVNTTSTSTVSSGTGISVTGTGSVIDSGLTITNTAPDQTVVLNNGTGISVTGTYPTFTVTNTAPQTFSYPFTISANYGSNNAATTTPIWAQNGLNASSTSHLVYASSTALSATYLCLSTDCRTVWPTSGSSDWTFANNYNAVNLTPTSTMPLWAQGGINASSTSHLVYASSTAVSANSFCLTGDNCIATWPTGGGGTFGQAWEIDGSGFLAPTTSITTLHPNGFLAQASSTILGGLTVDKSTTTNATTTNLYVSGQTVINGGLRSPGSTISSGLVSLGDNNSAGDTYSVAIGAYNSTPGFGSVAMGFLNQSTASYAVSMGVLTRARGEASVAMGNSSEANGQYSVAMGNTVIADANNTVAFGSSYTNSTTSSFSVGYGAKNFAVESGKALVYGQLGISSTTPGTDLSIGDSGANTINISASATSTFGSGLNIRTGCYAINGTCLSTFGTPSVVASIATTSSGSYFASTTPMTAGQVVEWMAACNHTGVSVPDLSMNYRTSDDSATTTVFNSNNTESESNNSAFGIFTATSTYTVTIEVVASSACSAGLELVTKLYK